MKRRMPKCPIKRARRRAELEAAGEYKRAMKARDGSQGPASRVRRIDPAEYLRLKAADPDA